MPGTFMKLGPISPNGSNHWKGVPSLNQGVKPPCRWVAILFRGSCPTVWVDEAMMVGSTGINPVLGSWFVTLSRTGVPLLATMTPARYFWSPVAKS